MSGRLAVECLYKKQELCRDAKLLHKFNVYKVDPYVKLIHAANLGLNNFKMRDWLVAKPTVRQEFYITERRKELISKAERAVSILQETSNTGGLSSLLVNHISDLLAELQRPSVDNSKILRAYFVIVDKLCHHLPDRDNEELIEQNFWGRKDVEDILRRHIFRPLSMSVEEQERKDKELRCRESCRRRTTTPASHSNFSPQGDDGPGDAALGGQQSMVRRGNSSSFSTSSVLTRDSASLQQQLNRRGPASRGGGHQSAKTFVFSHFSRSGANNNSSYSLGIERRTGLGPTPTVHPISLSGHASTTRGIERRPITITGSRRRRHTEALELALARYDEERSQSYGLLGEDPSLRVTLRTVDDTGRLSTSSSIVFHAPAPNSEMNDDVV